MSRFINRKTVLTLVGVLLLVIISLSIWISVTQKDKYAILEEEVAPSDRVSVDFSQYDTLFTPVQESEIQITLRTMTTKNVSDTTQFTGNIRGSSVKQASARETSLIIDSPDLQTSYLVSRFVSPEDNLDIINVVCVDESQKIYKQDYCLVE